MNKTIFRLFLPVLMLLITAMMAACSDSDNNSKKNDSQDTTITYRRSLIVYMAAQNSLGDAGAARLDSAEIVAGVTRMTSTRDNVFLFIDDGSKPRVYRYYRAGKTGNVHAYEQKILTWADDVNSGDPATLRDLLRFISISYPSTSYGLVMWSHGNGWIPSTNVQNTMSQNSTSSMAYNPSSLPLSAGTAAYASPSLPISAGSAAYASAEEKYPSAFGVDVGEGGDMENDTDSLGKMGTQMDITDMADAIEQSGVHLDYILFDACLMQCVEVAYDLRNVTDYIVASASSTSGYGGYYVNLLPQALMVYPANDYNVTLIASQYYYDAVQNPNTDAITGQSLRTEYGNCGVAISVIKTSELENLASITGTYIPRYITNRQEANVQEAQAYSTTDLFNMPDYYDMGSAMNLLLSSDDYESWLQQAEKCIIFHHVSNTYTIGAYNGRELYVPLTDSEHVLGVSMFVPRRIFDGYPYSPYNTYFQQTSWYAAASWAQTGW